MRNTPQKLLMAALILLSVIGCPALADRIIYVDCSAAGANDGSSWADAYNYLQDAFVDANSSGEPAEILLAQGTYVPDKDSLHPGGTGDREAAFLLTRDITLRGGYAGSGKPDPNERDIEAYETILSGDLNSDDAAVADPCDLLTEPTRTENSYHVVSGILRPYCNGVKTVELDGLTISGGNANGRFSGLDSHGSGGGIGLVYNCYRLKVANCTFRDNTAEDGAAIGGLRGQIVNCLITNNASFWNGGGVSYCRGLIQGCTMEGNYAGYSGGALYLWGESPQIEDCTFSNNTAESGGGLFIADAEPNLIDCTFSGNSAAYGGGMHSTHFDYAPSPTLLGCTFIDNTAVSGGGMYNNDGYARVINCTFRNNRAGDFAGGMWNYHSSPVLINCTFQGNEAEWGGGGMRNNEHSSPTLTNCTFNANSAGGGGAIRNENFSAPIFKFCTFTANSAGLGGAMYNPQENTLVLANNCLFAGNSAYDGGAIANDDCHQILTGCTFTGNTTEGGQYSGVIENDENECTLINCILWNNLDGHGQVKERTFGGSADVLAVNYSCIQGWTGIYGGTGNIDADPCFADAGYWDANGTPEDANDDFWVDGDYHLKSQAGRWNPNEGRWVMDDVTSPCIDAGDPMSPVGLEPFANGGIVNMGVYGGSAQGSKSYFGGPPCDVIVAGDINGDCVINFLDFQLMALHWCEDNSP